MPTEISEFNSGKPHLCSGTCCDKCHCRINIVPSIVANSTKVELPQHKPWHELCSIVVQRELARDLYQLHLDTGISLDKWSAARALVEFYYGKIEDNNV